MKEGGFFKKFSKILGAASIVAGTVENVDARGHEPPRKIMLAPIETPIPPEEYIQGIGRAYSHEERIKKEYSDEKLARSVVEAYRQNILIHNGHYNRVIELRVNNPVHWKLLDTPQDTDTASEEYRARIELISTATDMLFDYVDMIRRTPEPKDAKEITNYVREFGVEAISKMDQANDLFKHFKEFTRGSVEIQDSAYYRLYLRDEGGRPIREKNPQ